MTGYLRHFVVLAATAIPLAAASLAASAETVEEFYKGKSLRFIIHTKAGGGYDIWGRLIGPYLAQNIPGNPTFVPVNMPGGGGIIAANHLYANAKQDGSVIGIIGRSLPYQALIKKENIRFDPVKFNWIGSPESTNRICAVTDKSPVKTAKEAFEKEALMGGAGAGTAVSTVPVLLNKLLGTKFKLVEGYGAAIEVQLAMERGEVHGICQSLNAIEVAMPGQIDSGKLIVLFNMERKPVPGAKYPSIHSFAKTDVQRKILQLFSSTIEFGRPFLAPPNVPADRVAALRTAFETGLKDPKLLSEAKKLKLDLAFVSGDELAGLIKDMMDTPIALVAQMDDLTK